MHACRVMTPLLSSLGALAEWVASICSRGPRTRCIFEIAKGTATVTSNILFLILLSNNKTLVTIL